MTKSVTRWYSLPKKEEPPIQVCQHGMKIENNVSMRNCKCCGISSIKAKRMFHKNDGLYCFMCGISPNFIT